jgi:hypothetical protein
MKEFKYCENGYNVKKLEEFSNKATGFLWLKIKSIIQNELVKDFTTKNKINLKKTAFGKQFEELFNVRRIFRKNSGKI